MTKKFNIELENGQILKIQNNGDEVTITTSNTLLNILALNRALDTKATLILDCSSIYQFNPNDPSYENEDED